MAPVTDLTWTQLNAAFRTLGYGDVVIIDAYGIPASIIPQLILQLSSATNANGVVTPLNGVIKFVAVLLEACRIAQEAANTGKPTGEKLAAFSAPTYGSLANGYAPITRTFATRAVLSSVTQVVGTNA